MWFIRVRSEARRESVQKLVGNAPVLVCDVEHEDQIAPLEKSNWPTSARSCMACAIRLRSPITAAVADSGERNETLSRNAQGRILAGRRYFLFFVDRCIQRIARIARSRGFGGHGVDFHHADGGGKLWFHGAS